MSKTRSFIAIALCICAWAAPTSAAEVRVAASANMRHALSAIADSFRTTTGHELNIDYGACGHFVRQILRDAPYEILLCSNQRYVDVLVRKGATLDEGYHFANDQLALFIPNGSSVDSDPGLGDLNQALEESRLRRLAIAIPELSPFGLQARNALEDLGHWRSLEPFTRLRSDPQTTLDFALMGEAEAALVPWSLAKRAQLEGLGLAIAVSQHLSAPLPQYLVLLKKARSATLEFANLMRTTEARALLEQHYFSVGR